MENGKSENNKNIPPETNASSQDKATAFDTALVKDKEGRAYAFVNIPSGWSVSAKRYELYGGYGYPFVFDITSASPNKHISLCYASPRNYFQDLLNEGAKALSSDDCGNLNCSFKPVETFLDNIVVNALGKYDNLRFVKQLPPPYGEKADYEALERQKYAETLKIYAESYPDRVLDSRYYRSAVRLYAYTYKGFNRMRACCALIDASAYTQNLEMPVPEDMKRDPYWRNSMASCFKGFHIDGRGRYMYLSEKVMRWFVGNLTYIDAPEDEFEAAYNSFYRPFACAGAKWQPSLSAELKARQAQKDKINKAAREDKAEAEKIYAQTARDGIKAAKQRADIMRRSNEDVSDIIRSTYENKSRAFDKANRDWSDSFMGYTRYTDSSGDEYKIKGYGEYAYRKNDIYVTTDDSESPGYDWERLEKKKDR